MINKSSEMVETIKVKRQKREAMRLYESIIRHGGTAVLSITTNPHHLQTPITHTTHNLY